MARILIIALEQRWLLVFRLFKVVEPELSGRQRPLPPHHLKRAASAAAPAARPRPRLQEMRPPPITTRRASWAGGSRSSRGTDRSATSDTGDDACDWFDVPESKSACTRRHLRLPSRLRHRHPSRQRRSTRKSRFRRAQLFRYASRHRGLRRQSRRGPRACVFVTSGQRRWPGRCCRPARHSMAASRRRNIRQGEGSGARRGSLLALLPGRRDRHIDRSSYARQAESTREEGRGEESESEPGPVIIRRPPRRKARARRSAQVSAGAPAREP